MMIRNVALGLHKYRSSLQLSRAIHIRGFWPEPVSQQTLDQFLSDINYFDEPRQFVDIGLDVSHLKPIKKPIQNEVTHDAPKKASVLNNPIEIDKVLGLLEKNAESPAIDYHDVPITGDELVRLANTAGIFRDLFGGEYVPNRDHIHFTPEQAERLDKLIPFFWVTDQPRARVKRHPKPIPPVSYFNPVIGISARFVNETPNDTIFSHQAFYGNIIPATEALIKPSITLDGRLLNPSLSDDLAIPTGEFSNWEPGKIQTVNFSADDESLYTVALVNLDHLHPNAGLLHWMAANIKPCSGDQFAAFEEACDYIPTHGIRGFGYSRLIFLVFKHNSKLDLDQLKSSGPSLDARKFDANAFVSQHQSSGLVPVGLSWFQTTWDDSSNDVFHTNLGMQAPVYDHVQTQYEKPEERNYPGRLPFNTYLDSYRSKKSINEQVLLERLKGVNPFDYKDQYEPPRVPPTVFEDPKGTPSWLYGVNFKKKNRLGYWRGLRPVSATLPLNNNADLDHPIRPIASSHKALPLYHNKMEVLPRRRPHKELPTSKPVQEFHDVFVQDDHEIHIDWAKEIMQKGLEKKQHQQTHKKEKNT